MEGDQVRSNRVVEIAIIILRVGWDNKGNTCERWMLVQDYWGGQHRGEGQYRMTEQLCLADQLKTELLSPMGCQLSTVRNYWGILGSSAT